MKRILLFLLLLCSISCYSQEFFGNSDYVYAKGIASSQPLAENAALLALAEKIGIEVTNVASYSYFVDEDGKVVERIKKDVGTSSSMSFGDEVETYIESFNKKKVVVYKYINVKEYVNKQKGKYEECLRVADSIYKRRSSIKHSKNLVLGQYYIAYKALDLPIMNVYNKNNAALKEKLFKKAEQIYKEEGKFGFLTLLPKTDSRGYFVKMEGERTAGLQNFEYKRNGEWELPYYFYYSVLMTETDGTRDAFTKHITRRCLLISDNSDIEARFLYEFEEEGALFKINVPEKWYFCDEIIDNTINNVK